MKERSTQEQRLQFLKQFGVLPEIANEEVVKHYELVAFDPEAHYARFEKIQRGPQDTREENSFFMEYLNLDSPPYLTAMRFGKQKQSENQTQATEGIVSYFQNNILTTYEPDYSGVNIDEKTGEIVGDTVFLEMSERFEQEFDTLLLSVMYRYGRLISAMITNRKGEEEIKKELTEQKQYIKQFTSSSRIDLGVGPAFYFSEENPELISIVLTNPESHPLGTMEFEPEAILNDYVVPDAENPDAYRITHGSNTYTFRRLNWENNSFWEVTVPENLSFEEVHSVATNDEWTRLKELHPVNFTQGKDPGIYFP